MRSSHAVKAGLVAAWLAIATALASGCSTTVGGFATCAGCGPGGEPSFPTGRPTAPPPTSTSRPTAAAPPGPTITTGPPAGGDTLPPTSSGYVYIETKSGQTRCQINTESVGCESNFTNPPVVDNQPANGVEVTAAGSVRWISGNLGAIPTTPLDYRSYHAVGWTIEADSSGTRFTNDDTGHGMFISTEVVEVF